MQAEASGVQTMDLEYMKDKIHVCRQGVPEFRL